MKKINSTILLTALGLIFSSANSFATDCMPAPDCASLGYNKTAADCEGLDTIKCQFDVSKVYCSQGASVSKDVLFGAILYGDGTVSNDLIAGKKPIGVVFDVINRLALALTDVKQDGSAGSEEMHWSSGYCDTPNLENCTNENAVITTCGIDGRVNTDAILATNGGCNGTTYPANAVNAYQTSNCSADFCKKGKWFLPSLRDLKTIYDFQDVINNSLKLLASHGASRLQYGFHWSSTEYDDSRAWKISLLHHFTGAIKGGAGKYSNDGYVRPVLAF